MHCVLCVDAFTVFIMVIYIVIVLGMNGGLKSVKHWRRLMAEVFLHFIIYLFFTFSDNLFSF